MGARLLSVSDVYPVCNFDLITGTETYRSRSGTVFAAFSVHTARRIAYVRIRNNCEQDPERFVPPHCVVYRESARGRERTVVSVL
jgi:hypothetical protein